MNEVPLGPQVLLNEVERGHPIRQRAKPAQVYAKYYCGGRFALRAPTGCRFTYPINISPLRG